MLRFVWVLALIAACGATATPRPHKPGDEWLAAIRIEGSTAIEPDDLIPRLGLYRNWQREGNIDDYQLSLDVARIAAAYQKLGFFAVDVKSKIIKPPKYDAATVVFVVTPGPRARTHVDILGLPPEVNAAEARAAVPLAEGAPFDYDTFDEAKQPLLELVGDAGYAHARLIANVLADRAHATAVLRYTIDPGPPSKFGQITLVGATGRLAEAVLVRIKFAEGEPYSRTAIAKTQTAIYGTGLFSTVRVEPDQDTVDPIVPVKITVTGITKNELNVGGGLGLDQVSYSLRGRFQYIRHGVITPLTTSNLDLRPAYAFETATCTTTYVPYSCKSDPRGRAIETLSEQDFLLTDVKGEVEGGVDYLVYEAYAKLGAHTRLGLSAPATVIGLPQLQLRVGWLFEAADFPSIYIDSVDAHDLGLDRVNYNGAYTAEAQLDLRDNPLQPTRGLYASVRVAKGTRYALGGFEYFQVTPELRGFVPLGKVVLALRARLGTITGDVPATERYYGGGISSMRGFGQRGLSPRALSADATRLIVIGGEGLIETSAELRIPLGSLPFSAVVFLDGGDVKRTPSELDLSKQYYATGLGLRWISPIGPIGIDVAYRLNRVASGDGHFNFLFAIGEAF